MKLKWKNFCKDYTNQRLISYGITLYNALGLYDCKKERTEKSWRNTRARVHDTLDANTLHFVDEEDELDIIGLCHLNQCNVQFFDKSRKTQNVELVAEFLVRGSNHTVVFQITRQAYESNNFEKLSLVTKKDFFGDSTAR